MGRLKLKTPSGKFVRTACPPAVYAEKDKIRIPNVRCMDCGRPGLFWLPGGVGLMRCDCGWQGVMFRRAVDNSGVVVLSEKGPTSWPNTFVMTTFFLGIPLAVVLWLLSCARAHQQTFTPGHAHDDGVLLILEGIVITVLGTMECGGCAIMFILVLGFPAMLIDFLGLLPKRRY